MSRYLSNTISIFVLISFISIPLWDKVSQPLNKTSARVGFVFILLKCLLYNEIIITTSSGFYKDTKGKIMQRSEEEINAIADDIYMLIWDWE